jgi:predicted  nucleic acid-binding Zn-ribbon protein
MRFGRKGSRRSGEADGESTSRRLRGRNARLRDVELRLEAALEQLEAQQKLADQLADKLAAQQSDHTGVESRIAEIEARQESELAEIRATRAGHQQDLARLHESVERHKGEVTALEQALDADQ